MQFIGATKNFSLLAQESFLAKNCILAGFDSLLSANYYCAKDGNFYSAFFNLAIGLERMMKLVIVTDHMLKNDLKAPTEGYLRGFGHEIETLYTRTSELSGLYGHPFSPPERDSESQQLLSFLAKFSTTARYYNLNEVGRSSGRPGPIEEWQHVAAKIYEAHTAWHMRDRNTQKVFTRMDNLGEVNNFTRYVDSQGSLLQLGDIRYLQMMTKKAAPLAIWLIVEMFQPIHFVLETMAKRGYAFNAPGEGITIPHYEEFFYFMLATLPSIKRRKRWLALFTA